MSANALQWDGAPGHRAGRSWTPRQELVAPVRAHLEYAQRAQLPEPALSLT